MIGLYAWSVLFLRQIELKKINSKYYNIHINDANLSN